MRQHIVSHEEWIKARREQWDNGRCAEMIASALALTVRSSQREAN
jgi:hypothetical protein